MSEQRSAENDASLSESQVNCLCAVWLGSKGNGSNARTLDSLLLRGLVTVRQHQGSPLWEATERGSVLAARVLDPEDGHHPNCYQNTGVPADLPPDLCDCRTLRMIDAASVLPPCDSAPFHCYPCARGDHDEHKLLAWVPDIPCECPPCVFPPGTP